MSSQVAISLARQIVSLQEWQLVASLLVLCAEALARDPNPGVPSFPQPPQFRPASQHAARPLVLHPSLDSI